MKRNRSSKPISSRLILIGFFIIFVLITGGLISVIVFSNWWASTDVIITNMEEDVTKDAIAQVDSFLDKPLSNNAANRILVEKGLVDMTDATEWERFFVGVLQAQDVDVYSFGYGMEDGAYYGARRNQNHVIEIIKNDAETNGSAWHYSVTEALTAGEKVLDAGKFDPRTSAWYLAAKIERQSVFSQAYKHFSTDDLSVSAAYPIFNQSGALQGVFETQVNLSRINDYLHAIVKEESAMAFIVEANTGALVASSSGILSYKKTGGDAVERQTIDAIDNPAIIQAYDNYKAQGISHATIWPIHPST